MRRQFADKIFDMMFENPKIYLLTADLGYKMWDKVQTHYSTRFIDVGAAEQLMMGAAVGLALEGKIPIVYSITPFLLCRAFEWIRNYLNHEKIPVKLVGSGRDSDYYHDGFTHNASDDMHMMFIFHYIRTYRPNNIEEMQTDTEAMISYNGPSYLNLTRDV